MSADIASALRLKLGALNVLDGAKTPFGAGLAVFPANEGEAADAVALAAEAGMAVLPAGGGTYVDALAPVHRDTLLLSSVRMNRIVEYHPEDLVATVEAGVPLATLQDALRRKRQFLPFNPPDPETATLGGIVATASTGLWRSAYGPVKDYVLEVRGVDGLARAVRGGARVVKNVAGYDVPKLYTGSRGTLVFLTQMTFKVRPLPEQTTRLAFTTLTWGAVYERLRAVAASDIRPAALEVARQDLRDANERPSGMILLEGSAETVQWQTSACMALLRGAGATVGRLDEAPAMPRAGDVEMTIRVRPVDALAVMEELSHRRWRGAAACAPMEGRVSARFVAYPDSAEQVADLRAWVEARGGVLTLERMPRPWNGVVDPWGTARADASLGAALKARLDPDNVFRAAPFPG